MPETEISEVDRLKLQVAWFKKERAREAFDLEVIRIGQAYGMTAVDSVDMDTGKISRKEK